MKFTTCVAHSCAWKALMVNVIMHAFPLSITLGDAPLIAIILEQYVFITSEPDFTHNKHNAQQIARCSKIVIHF